jgi:thiol-disulfide isomerase/thioredoxin
MSLLFTLIFPFLVFSPKDHTNPPEFKVYVFVAETCPICQFYTKKIREINKEYTSSEIIFVYPNKLSSEESIKKFHKKYKLDFDYIIDTDLELVNKFNAEITPEVFVYNESQDSVYYQGRIDDFYYKLGKRRAQIKSDDLIHALNSIRDKKKIEIPQTKAVGCFITKK